MKPHCDGVGVAAANGIVALGIVFNALAVVVVGRVSDRLQLRKPFVLAGTAATVALLAYFVALVGGRPDVAHLTTVYALIFLAMGVAYVPWMAGYSEDAEDVRPSLRGAALGLWGMAVRVMIVALLVVAPRVVAGGGQVVFLLSIAAYGGRWRRVHPEVAPAGAPADRRSVTA